MKISIKDSTKTHSSVTIQHDIEINDKSVSVYEKREAGPHQFLGETDVFYNIEEDDYNVLTEEEFQALEDEMGYTIEIS